MKNDNEPSFNESQFKKNLDALEEEYEMELQQLHAEIEQEKIKSAETSNKNPSQFEK